MQTVTKIITFIQLKEKKRKKKKKKKKEEKNLRQICEG